MLDHLIEKRKLVTDLAAEHGLVLALTTAVVGWALYFLERSRCSKAQRQLSQARAPGGPQVELLEEEEKLEALQAELEALSAELQQSCPRTRDSQAQQRRLSFGRHQALSSPAGSSSSTTSRRTSVAGLFQQRLRQLDVGAGSCFGGNDGWNCQAGQSTAPGCCPLHVLSPASQGQIQPHTRSPNLHHMLTADDDDATTWLLDSEQKAASAAATPATVRSSLDYSCSPARTRHVAHMQMLGLPSPPSEARRAAGGSSVRAAALGVMPRRSSSMPGSPRLSQGGSASASEEALGTKRLGLPLRRPGGCWSEAGTPLPTGRSLPDAAPTGGSRQPSPLSSSQLEAGRFLRSPSHLSDPGAMTTYAGWGKAAPAGLFNPSSGSGSKIPKVPPMSGSGSAAGTPRAAGSAGADFRIGSFRSSTTGGLPPKVTSPGRSPSVPEVLRFTTSGGAKAAKFSPATMGSVTASRIPKPSMSDA
ncbi:hypothetical protein N2152v2_008118 [Parachlorella kessleri]